MKTSTPAFPFFTSVAVRPLTDVEREVVLKLLENQELSFQLQVPELKVVGRCGCGKCPTVFFLPDEPKVKDSDLVTYFGKDEYGGVVAAVLLQKAGQLSQLEFYSVDGHDPWSPPRAEMLAPYA